MIYITSDVQLSAERSLFNSRMISITSDVQLSAEHSLFSFFCYTHVLFQFSNAK